MFGITKYVDLRSEGYSVKDSLEGMSPADVQQIADFDEAAALYVSLKRLVEAIGDQLDGKFPRCPICDTQWDSRTGTELHDEDCAYQYAVTTIELDGTTIRR